MFEVVTFRIQHGSEAEEACRYFLYCVRCNLMFKWLQCGFLLEVSVVCLVLVFVEFQILVLANINSVLASHAVSASLGARGSRQR